MKRLSILLFGVLMAVHVSAQEKPVSIVFDVTSADPATHQSALRHVKFMSSSYPDSNFEVVVYSGSIDMVLKDKSTVAEDIESLADQKNVSFKVCAMTMKRHQIDKDELFSNVDVVPDGILEIAMKQAEGWGYIKESHQ